MTFVTIGSILCSSLPTLRNEGLSILMYSSKQWQWEDLTAGYAGYTDVRLRDVLNYGDCLK